jgi:hypothetical protein
MLQAGETPNLEAALVRDLGNAFEREIPQLVRLMAPGRRCAADDRLEGGASRDRIAHVVWTLAGGTFSGARVSALFLLPSTNQEVSGRTGTASRSADCPGFLYSDILLVVLLRRHERGSRPPVPLRNLPPALLTF